MKRALVFGVFISALTGYVSARMVESIVIEDDFTPESIRPQLKTSTNVRTLGIIRKAKVSRLDAIETLLRQKKKINIRLLRGIFPDVSERTLRRDMEKLEKRGIVKQKGHTKDTSYSLVSK